MTQMRAFAKRLGVTITDLSVDTRVVWDWQAQGRVYETVPKSFEINVRLDSPDPEEDVLNLIATAKKGCFLSKHLACKTPFTTSLRLRRDGRMHDAPFNAAPPNSVTHFLLQIEGVLS